MSLINPRPYWNYMTLKFVKRYRSLIHKDGKMVNRSIDKKLRLRIFDSRNESIETRQWFKNRSDQRSVERGPRESWKWKAKKQCSKGDTCSFRHDENMRVKPKPTSAPPSELLTEKDGRNTSRRECLRGLSPTGKLS